MKYVGRTALACLAFAATALPAAAHGPGPGTVFSCDGGKVTKASYVIVTSGPPKGAGFVATAQVGSDAATVCAMINTSAGILGNLKTEMEGNTTVVVYGPDIRLNQIPAGIKITIKKF